LRQTSEFISKKHCKILSLLEYYENYARSVRLDFRRLNALNRRSATRAPLYRILTYSDYTSEFGNPLTRSRGRTR
jgi:hypothetical protein